MKEIIEKWTSLNSFKGSALSKNRESEKIIWEIIFTKDISHKGLLTKIHKNLLKFNNRKMDNLLKKWAKDMNSHLVKEDTHTDSK